MRSLLGLVLAALLAAAECGSAHAVALSVLSQGPTIVRETPAGEQRLVTLSISNPAQATLEGLVLEYHTDDGPATRELIAVPPGGARDTLWLREPLVDPIPVRLLHNGAEVWTGELTVPAPEGRPVLIPRSDTVRAEQLGPLTLRGTNYLPRRWPWPGLWREATRETFESEFAQMRRLFMNSFRTFYFFDEEAGLVGRDGAFTPELLARINTLLEVADRQGLKVMICLTGSLPHLEELDTWRRFVRTGVEPFAYDGRVLMWDLINEPGGSEGPKATPQLARWITTMYAHLQTVAPNHLLTVGLCWQFDQLWDLGVRPPVAQFHNYSGAVGVQPPGSPPVRSVADDLRAIQAFIGQRPLVIGEFGYATVPDDARKDASPERQLEIYEGVLKGAQVARIAGVYNWTLMHFIPDWMGKGEQSFGVVLPNDSLKPAGELLRETYRRWREEAPATWEVSVPEAD